ncbi:LPXTG cell wall anchor domain-containing protein [Streptomyces sp. Je 1-79]|uniref:LPXTG cell wall anchor domain-containing protein n=1 Tax=Streptomyces sp. Je 1-79 TaxID=2943847 RepID=UPI0021A53B1A|nr:LPXTG cell wall anchor domain-containing protein [Streptomyces sp. Je 1-79]MCT4355928.1 LPXTG cell wall anchor domain-containing protein [Streptomyces sp. Je 1-79]
MKIRRILATAVAAAVTTPVVFLSAAPAFADTKPSAPSQTQEQEQQPTIEELQKKVAEAQKAYDAAVVAYDASQKALDALDKPDHLLQIAVADAKKAAEKATLDKTAADQAVVDAQAKLDAAVTDEEKAAAQTVLDEAKTKATTAATAKTTADANVTKANTALESEQAELFKKTGEAKTAKDEALKVLDAAKKALADAEPPHPDCVNVSEQLKVTLTGPTKVVAGTSVDFKLQITNGTGKNLDSVYGMTGLYDLGEKDTLADHTELKWGPENAEWEKLDTEFGFIDLGELDKGEKVDLLVRMTVDAKAPKTEGTFIADFGYDNKDGSCGFAEEGARTEFQVDAKPGDQSTTGGTTGGGNTGTTQQGGTSTTSVTTTGQLANTGSSDVMPQFALAGAAAVALGAGAMFVVRRRKAGADA